MSSPRWEEVSCGMLARSRENNAETCSGLHAYIYYLVGNTLGKLSAPRYRFTHARLSRPSSGSDGFTRSSRVVRPFAPFALFRSFGDATLLFRPTKSYLPELIWDAGLRAVRDVPCAPHTRRCRETGCFDGCAEPPRFVRTFVFGYTDGD